ncbi:MAG TPA: NAD(P)H-hydrate dehydratase [Actinomycetota bacterium]|nr:NAD(P)H-hydrate dehydratase [Actinomycetota bacterium]
MEPALTPAQMRRFDQAAIAAGVRGAELMDRAAHACAVSTLRLWGGAYGRRAVIVCGKGSNGGDGYGAARHLARAGATVTVLELQPPIGDAATHREMLRGLPGVRVLRWDRTAFERATAGAHAVVDAVFGTGFTGEPTGVAREAMVAMGEARVPVVSVDIPSGVDGSTGAVTGAAVRADVTVAIQALKVGHVAVPGSLRCGRIDVADIGIDVGDASVWVPGAADVAEVLPPLEEDTHKYRVGALGVLAGSEGMTGAAVLVARAALRSGAGLVVLGLPRSSLDVVEAAVPEAVKVGLPDAEGRLGAKAFDEFADRLPKLSGLAIGPGLGRGPGPVELVARALETDLPLVVDADGLWALAEVGSDAMSSRGAATVLTPHGGEAARLLGRELGPDRLAAARELASSWRSVVHLKGRRAVTAAPDGTCWVNVTGNPGLATGGTGDVLTGVAGALVARGADPAAATWAAAWLHGTAGDIAAARLGRSAMAAGDVVDALPLALRRTSRRTPPYPMRTVVEAP